MREKKGETVKNTGKRTIPVDKAVGTVLAHDITEIRPGEFKGRAFKKGHIVRKADISYLKRLGKENLFILKVKRDEMHENDAAFAIAKALAGNGVKLDGEPSEGRINLVAAREGLLKVDQETLFKFNMLGEVMCATIHSNSVVKKGQLVAGTRAIPLVVKKSLIGKALRIAKKSKGVLNVKEIRKPRAGVVITGNEVYYGRVRDAFTPVIKKKIKNVKGRIIGIYFAPDNISYIKDRVNKLITAGADLIILTGGMSVDPDDVTRFAIRKMGVKEPVYGSPVLPGAMFLVAYVRAKAQKRRGTKGVNLKTSALLKSRTSELIPVVGIPACGMYSSITVFDMILPRVLAGEKIGRQELALLGHGGLCLKCKTCKYPVCPFGK